jgi:hypothetical protein
MAEQRRPREDHQEGEDDGREPGPLVEAFAKGGERLDPAGADALV